MLEFIILTGVRVSEARLATWEQFDLHTMIWNVPPENRKTGHLNGKVRPVPITPPMLAVLKEMRRRPIECFRARSAAHMRSTPVGS
jgi:integrase